jgi:hypothetical protein
VFAQGIEAARARRYAARFTRARSGTCRTRTNGNEALAGALDFLAGSRAVALQTLSSRHRESQPCVSSRNE